MRNTALTLVFILAIGQLCHFGLPWWTLALIGALAGWFFPQSAWRSLLAGFLGGFLLWVSVAFLLDRPNEGLLSGRIGNLFLGLSREHILLLTGLLGGLLAGLGCLTGRLGKVIYSKE